MKKKLLAAIVCFTFYFNVQSQTNIFPPHGAAGIGTTSPDPSSLLDVVSTTKGILIPRMNKNQRDAIHNPSTGLLIYQTNSNPGFYYYDGTKWTLTTAKSANRTLSNLTGPTAINKDLLTDSFAIRNIGAPANWWNNIYMAGDLFINGGRFVSEQGEGNAFLGQFAGYYNTARYVTALGSYALFNNEGDENTAVGQEAMYSNLTGNENTAVGNQALYSNTTGYFNTAIGDYSLTNNTTGGANTAVGLSTLINNISGGDNTAIGTLSLSNNKNGGSNTALGTYAGNFIIDGSSNTFVGYFSNCGSGGHLINGTAIGNQATVTSNNHVVIGNSSITSIGGYANWSNLSDGRVKKNIKQNVPGLAFINKLEPITYNLDLDAADKIIDRPQIKDKDGKIIQPSQTDLDARKAKEQIVYTGFVAQDVEKAAQSLHYDFSGVDKPDNANTLYGLRYSDFVVPLVKGMQELSKANDARDASIDSLKSEIGNLKSEIEELKTMIVAKQPAVSSQLSTVVSSASLSQNIPNPFSNSTTISYSIPQQFSSAKIIITDKNGNALKQINLSNSKGNITVDAATLTSGAYQYSLYVDGKIINTKQMIISK